MNVKARQAILTAVLKGPHKRNFASVLVSMPNVGLDTDFERPRTPAQAPRVFD